MLTFFKKKKKNKTPTPPRQPPQSSNLRRHISLPLIDTGTQVDLSPKILKPEQSLLNYSSSLQDSDNGYSTVRDAIIHIPSHRNNITTSNNRHEDDEDSINSRPLPAVPGRGQRIERSLSDSTFTNVTQDDDILSVQTDSYMKTKSKQLNDSSDIHTPIYAVINKESKRKRGTTKGTHPQQDTNKLQKPLRTTPITETVTCEVHDPLLLSPISDIVQSTSIPSDVFELSDTEESCDMSCDMSYDESLDQDSSQRPSSPLIVPTHRPPPSPNPRPNPKPQQNKSVISPSEHRQSSKEIINPSGSTKSRSSSYSSKTPDLSDLPVYNLNQSLTEGYIMSRTDRDGKIEYFTATPILNSPTLPLSLSNQSHHGYGPPLISSTPMKNDNTAQARSNNSIPVQSNPQTSIPTVTVPIQHQFPIPLLPQSPIPVLPHSPIPILPHSPTPPHSPVPVLLHSPNPVPPQPLPHPLYNTVASSSNVPSLSLPQQLLHKRLSTSQPLLNKPNLAGLTEINKILLHHQHTRQRTPENVPREDSVAMETDVVLDTSGIHQTDNNGKSTKDESTRGVSGSHGGNEIELMKRENDSLRETINHLTHQMTSVEHKTETVTADELVTNTPLKLKRVLDTLMCENEQKDKLIQTLKMEQLSLKKLCDELKTKNDILDKSHKEVLESSINERQALNTSMTKVYNENKILQQKFKTSSDKLKITKKDYDRKVDVMKEEIRLLRNEMGRFQSSVHTIDYQYQQQQIHNVSLDEHKQAVTRLERLLHQTMKDTCMQISPAVSVQHTVELSVISQLKQDNQRLAIELAEMKGRLSIVIEECTILRKQSRDYEGTIFSLNKDLKYSQAREMEALKCLNESINGRTTKKSKPNYTVDSSQSDIEQLLKKQDRAAVRQEAGQQTLDKFRNHDKRNPHQKKSREKMKELRSELTRKDQALEEMQHNKRIAEKQRDLLWQSRTTDGIFRH